MSENNLLNLTSWRLSTSESQGDGGGCGEGGVVTRSCTGEKAWLRLVEYPCPCHGAGSVTTREGRCPSSQWYDAIASSAALTVSMSAGLVSTRCKPARVQRASTPSVVSAVRATRYGRRRPGALGTGEGVGTYGVRAVMRNWCRYMMHKKKDHYA